MKILDLECPSCGAKLTIDEKNPSIAVCEYCNSHFALEWDREQAYFHKGINYTAPKAPEQPKDGGWGVNGVKGAVLLCIFAAFFIIVSVASKIFSGGGISGRKIAFSGSQPAKAVEIAPPYMDEGELFGEEETLAETSPTGALGEMVSEVFGKAAEEVSPEELAKIRWIEIKGDFDNRWVGYSMDEPFAEGAELSWMCFPRSMDTGIQSLRLFGGLKKLSVEQNIEKEDIEGLLLESIGGYFDSPAEVAEAVEDAGLLKEICFHSGVETLDGLENFPALEMLYIDYCELSDLKPLVQIPDLKSLKLDGLSEVKDFSPLGAMKNLEELSLDCENLKVPDFLKGMQSLRSLELLSGSMISLDELKSLPALEALVVEDCGDLKNMDAVTGLTGLKALSLELPYDCPEPDLSGLAGLEKLELSLFDNCDFVGKLTNLKELSLKMCSLSPDVDLSALTQLRSLTCSSYTASTLDLRFASNFTALETLDLQGTSTYDDISWAFNSGTIKELNISGMECEINFDLIGENHVLETLSMDGLVLYNNVQVSGGGGIVYVDWDDVELDEHTEFLGRLKGLKNLSIAENELTDITFAGELSALETIDLSENYVTDLKPLSGLKSLKRVTCTGNPISNERVLGEKVLVISADNE